MNTVDPNATKYLVKAKINADGVVDKPDVVGAIFGQTEGLLGDDLDLRDLQKSGRIGRIEVEVACKGGKSEGLIIMSSSLDQVETSIISAALETIDRVGPCKAGIKVLSIEDVRVTKREKIVERAKELLTDLVEQARGTGANLANNIRASVQVDEITTYGKERCPAGPNVKNAEAIIIVEGRSDVLNLLKAGIKNAVAVEGTNIPQSIQELSRERVTTAFVDGDRGGELILRELFQTSEIDFVARAPRSQEVEELTAKALVKCLRNKIPGDQYMQMNGLHFEETELPSETPVRAAEPEHVVEEERPRRSLEGRSDRREKHERRQRDYSDDDEEGEGRRSRRERRQRDYDDEEESDDRKSRRDRRERRQRDYSDDEEEGEGRRSRRERRQRDYDDEEESDDRRSRREKRGRRSEERGARFDSDAADRFKKKRHDDDAEREVVVEVEVEEPETPTEPVVEVVEEPVVAVEETVEVPAEPVVEEAPAVAEEPVVEELPRIELRPNKRDSRNKKASSKMLTPQQEGLRTILLDVIGTHNAVLLNAENEEIGKIQVKELADYITGPDAPQGIVAVASDGVIGQRLVDVASQKNINILVGKKKGKITKLPSEITVWVKDDLD